MKIQSSNPVNDIIADYLLSYPSLKAEAEKAWEIRNWFVNKRADTDDPQKRRMLAVAIDALEDVACEIERMASEAYRKAWEK